VLQSFIVVKKTKKLLLKKKPIKMTKVSLNPRRVFQLNKNVLKNSTFKFGMRRLNLSLNLPKLQQIFVNYKKNDLYVDGKLLKALALELIKNQKSYRSRRLRNKMPVRGQRTHTNAKTRRKRDIK
jgi:ribosomal protein S13